METDKHQDAELVSIVILNYNGGEWLVRCLSSVLNTDYPSYEVIVIDNGSTDGSIEEAERAFTGIRHIKYIKNNRNLGFCVGNNVGIRESHGKYIVLLNNDTIVTQNWLRELMKEARRIGKGFFNPKILLINNPQMLDSAGNNLHLAGLGLARGLGEIDKGQYDKFEEVAYANGTCLLVPRKVIEEIGLLDPIFFAYNEDVDWCWRGRIFGIKSYYVPSAIVYHKLGASWGRITKNKLYLVERNRIITYLKNYSSRTLRLLFPILLTTEIFILFHFVVNGWLREKINIYSDLFRLRNYIKTQRTLIQKNRKVEDNEVIKIFCEKINHPYIKHPAVHILNILCSILLRIVRLKS